MLLTEFYLGKDKWQVNETPPTQERQINIIRTRMLCIAQSTTQPSLFVKYGPWPRIITDRYY